MDALLKKKDSLERRLEELRDRREDRISRRDDLAAGIRLRKDELEKTRTNLRTVKSVLLEKKQRFMLLRKEVVAYKKSRLEDVREEHERLYRSIFEEASRIRPSTSFSTFAEFTRIKELMDRNVFRHLGRRLDRFYMEEKERLRKHILEQLEKRMQDKRKVHELIFQVKFLHRYEDYFGENIAIDFLYNKLLRGFEYHFMSSKESNRLDKPEWFLDFILAKLGEYREFFGIYEETRVRNVVSPGDNRDAVDASFGDLVQRCCSLVEMKIEETVECSSKQRRSLLLNLGAQVRRFRSEVHSSYGVSLDFSSLGAVLCKEQRSYVRRRLSEIHGSRYVSWFGGYKELSRECLFCIYRFRDLDFGFGMEDVVRPIIEYNAVFLESLRYINREEIRAICLLFSEFEEYKTFLLELENEMMFDSRLVIAPGSGSREDETFCEAVSASLEEISDFNSGNLRLIMSLAANDAGNGLRSMRRFLYDPNEASRSLMVDISRFLEDYRDCASYKAVEHMVKEKVDTFILEDILLRYKLDTEQYFEVVELLKKLKELFEDEDWKSDVASKYVGNVFEGVEGNGSLFKIIRKLYE